MSLLLQALRQIDSKEPACLAPVRVPSATPAIAAPATVAATTLEPSSSPETVLPDFDARADLAGPAERQLAEQVREYLRPSDRVLALASAEPTFAAGQLVGNLALGLACQNQQVLVVEGAAVAAHKLSTARPIDLADVVSGRVALDEAAVHTADRHVYALPIKPGFRLTATELAGVWKRMRDQFQYVVLDTDGFDEASATALLASCEAAFFAVRIGQNSRRQVQRRREFFHAAGVELRACLVIES
ncbi:MAG TPA: hypothetical protein VJ783_32120 [Pirellulales bacterium]|nr:hypothetical protein [Pirellulales bacterium]